MAIANIGGEHNSNMTTQNNINANSTSPLHAIYGGTQLATLTAHAVLGGRNANTLAEISLGAGATLIGVAVANTAHGATLTAGFGIGITSTSGSIVISNTLPQESWSDVTASSQTIVVGMSYTASNAGAVTFTLPSTAAFGTTVTIMTGSTAGGWVIAQNAGQVIQFGTVQTTSGTGGSLASTAAGDAVTLVCYVANTNWQLTSSMGNIIVT